MGGITSLDALVGSEDGVEVGHLVGLEGLVGLSSSLKQLTLASCTTLSSLAGLEKLSALQELSVRDCGITSLQRVADMKVGLTRLCVHWCSNVQEDVLELPEIHSTAHDQIIGSSIKKVLVAGSVSGRVHEGITLWA